MAHFMGLALEQAKLSALMGEIPVGAVIVSDGKIIASAHNTCIADCNVSRHAEINALAQAGSEMQNYRLDGCDIYITLEPCAMCASALIQARIRRVIYGAAEPKTGAAGSIVNLFADKRLNTHTAIRGGILQEECRAVLSRFFKTKEKVEPMTALLVILALALIAVGTAGIVTRPARIGIDVCRNLAARLLRRLQIYGAGVLWTVGLISLACILADYVAGIWGQNIPERASSPFAAHW